LLYGRGALRAELGIKAHLFDITYRYLNSVFA